MEAHPESRRSGLECVLTSMSATLINQALFQRLTMRADLGKSKVPIGSINAMQGKYLIDDKSIEDSMSASSNEEEVEILNDLYDSVTQEEIDLDEIMAVSAVHAGRPKGVDPAHLSKIWKIDLKTAERTLGVVL